MAIEHEGKYYEEVTDYSAEIGDLIHVSEVCHESCDIWCFTMDASTFVPYVDVRLPDNYNLLDIDVDKYKRYREVQAPVETTETPPKPYETGRYKVASIDGDKELYVNSAGNAYVMLTRDITLAAYFIDESNANKLAETANTYGIGTFSIYKEVASLVRLEDDNA